MFSYFSKRGHICIMAIAVICSFTRCTNELKVQSSELLEPYNEEQIVIIQDHWKQYFKDDIFAALGSGEAVFPIAFDSYGAIYPNDSLFLEFDEDNFAAGLPGKMDQMKNVATLKHSDNDLLRILR
ncbi:hypothetical protein O3Q51_10055 [Cryomorphaceae bacterium 1068]|nr:hypothetical protein [Cryomorphaceae bacterium 1068]